MIDLKSIPEQSKRYYTYLEPIIADPLVRGYFTLVASLLLVAFFLVFALSPTANTILALQKKIADQKKTVLALDTKISNLIIAQQNFSQVESLIPVLETALPKKPSPQVAIDQIIGVASSSAVTLSNFRFNAIELDPGVAVVTPEGYSALPFSFSINGSKNAAFSFLTSLENSLRYVRFKNLAFFFPASDPLTISVDVVGLTYYYVDEK